MMLPGWVDRPLTIDALLDVARRETLLLAVAFDAMDDDRAIVAAARLRWAISSVRHLLFATRCDDALHRVRSLDRIANRAQRWLTCEPARSPQEIAGVFSRLATRELHAGPPRPGLVAEHASLIDLDLDDLTLGPLLLRSSILTDVSLRRARCDGSDARATRWLRCPCEGASFELAVFASARIEHGELALCQLEGASFHLASLSHTSLRGARLIDTRLDGATFTDCNLRGAELSVSRSSPVASQVASLAGARFIRCDLRDACWDGRELLGAQFIDCQS